VYHCWAKVIPAPILLAAAPPCCANLKVLNTSAKLGDVGELNVALVPLNPPLNVPVPASIQLVNLPISRC